MICGIACNAFGSFRSLMPSVCCEAVRARRFSMAIRPRTGQAAGRRDPEADHKWKRWIWCTGMREGSWMVFKSENLLKMLITDSGATSSGTMYGRSSHRSSSSASLDELSARTERLLVEFASQRTDRRIIWTIQTLQVVHFCVCQAAGGEPFNWIGMDELQSQRGWTV